MLATGPAGLRRERLEYLTQSNFLWQQLVNGLTLGGLYALIALGYTMVYGVLQFINFAHGEVFMVGAYVGFLVYQVLGAALPGSPMFGTSLAFLGAMGGCALLGMAIERLAYRPLRQTQRLAPLITAIGVSLCLQNLVMLSAGKAPKPYPAIFAESQWAIGEVSISSVKIFMIISAVTLMIGMFIFINKSKQGTALRAISLDQRAASLMGISVDRMIGLTFALGSALGAAAGVLVGLYYGQISFFMGYGAGLKAFTAAVLGGIGNIPGAMVGGLLLGILEAVGGSISSQYQNAIAFLVLIGMLTIRPNGLMGERSSDRV